MIQSFRNSVICTCILFFWSLILFGQETIKMKVVPFSDSFEEYYVLKKNKAIKQGTYRLVINNVIFQQGQFDNNKRVGIWTVYSIADEVDFKYNFDTNKLSELNKENLGQYNDTLNRKPLFLGGFNTLLNKISYSMELTDYEHDQVGFGYFLTEIKVNIDKNGIIQKFSVNTSSDKKILDKLSLKAVQKYVSEFPFLPAIKNGLPVDSSIIIPIQFNFTLGK